MTTALHFLEVKSFDDNKGELDSAYGIVAGSDNTVTRLFGLNYVSLALSLGIVVMFFRYNLLHRWFRAYVQKEAFQFVSWALPLLSLSASIAFLAVAAA